MRKLPLAFLALAMFPALLSSTPRAFADTITLTLSNPDQSAKPGTTTFFDATVSAPITNTGTEFLNGDSFSVDSPGILDDTGFLNSFPLSLAAGQSFTGLLFTIAFPPNTPLNTYLGSFDILGGPTESSLLVLSSSDFQVNVTPEPPSALLLGTALVGLLAAASLRRKSSDAANI
jgi:hypothetical protein